MRPVISRHNRVLGILLAAASALMFAALLLTSNEISAQQPDDTPMPAPAQFPSPTPSIESSVIDLPPLKGKINPPKYPKLDSTLNRIAEQAKSNGASAQQEEPVGVTFYIEEGKVEGVEDYLESKGVSVRNVGVDYIEAYLPPSLLVEASDLPGVINIRTISLLRPAQETQISPKVEPRGTKAWYNAGYGEGGCVP